MQVTYSSGGVVLNPQGQVLLVCHDDGAWSFPKGHVEDGERKLDAAVREIYEESGIQNLEFVRELGTYTRFRIENGIEDKSELKHITLFLFNTTEANLHPTQSDVINANWFDKEEIAGKLLHPKDVEFFMSIKNTLETF